MPRPDLTTNLVPAPLSLTIVADRLGISPSTLRTWERRYGLGPARETGRHRRYTTSEFELIQTVVELVRSGISPADACESARNANAIFQATHETIDTECLINHVKQGNYAALHTALDVLITRDGLLRTWGEAIQPALVKIQTDEEGEVPGISPSAFLHQVTLQVIREVAERAHRNHTDLETTADSVLVVSDGPRSLLAHVIGVSLNWEGIPARLLPTLLPVNQVQADVPCMVNKTCALADKLGAQLLVVCGSITHNQPYLQAMADTGRQLLLVGPAKPTYLPEGATHLRTASACVDEVLAYYRGY